MSAGEMNLAAKEERRLAQGGAGPREPGQPALSLSSDSGHRKGLASCLKLQTSPEPAQGTGCLPAGSPKGWGGEAGVLAIGPGSRSHSLQAASSAKGQTAGLCGLVAAESCVLREQQRKAGPGPEALKPHFKHIPQKAPPLETDQCLLAVS